MNDILSKIVESKKREIEARKKAFPREELEQEIKHLPKEPSFKKAIEGKKHISLIAEIKRASPSRGYLRDPFDETKFGKLYLNAGVAAISVVTDFKFFVGNDQMLRNLRKISPIPLLRKDFILDEYQILESKFLGADAILFIASLFSVETLRSFIQKAQALSMDVLVEVGDERDLEKALLAGADIIGINNRNLKDFSIDLKRTLDLLPLIPDGKIIVSESGFQDPQDLIPFNGKLDAVLIGSTFIQAENPAEKIQQFLSVM